MVVHGAKSSRRTVPSLMVVLGLCALLLSVLAGCGSSSAATTSTPEKPLLAKDVNGTAITIPTKTPSRIISLTPGDSEMLGALGLSSKVVAVDAYTDYPASMTHKKVVTDASTGKVNTEAIVGLQPDLVLSWGGFTHDADLALMQQHIQVVDLPQKDLTGTLLELHLVGQLTHSETAANKLVNSLQQRIDAVKHKVAGLSQPSVYMEVGFTPPPPYAYGGGSFGDELIRDAGGTNIFGSNTGGEGYPKVSQEAIIKDNPQVILLTEDPKYGGNPADVAKRTGWGQVAAVKDHQVYQIDSNIIQRPGPRLVDALEQIAKILHPAQFK